MPETFNPQSQERSQENSPEKEGVRNLCEVFDQAEAVFAAEGREGSKAYLPRIYDVLIALNKSDKEEWETLWVWNPDEELTEQEFDSLNTRRKLLSNTIGIKTESGATRHDLNEI